MANGCRGICGEPANQVDHIGDCHDHRYENLQALRERHHKHKSAAKGNVSHRPLPNHFRRPERHPETS
ncbi:hypothetical protein GCM10009551_051370 [Nocardiopsis tropica]